MSKRDYYEVLGLQKNATAADIKKAFKQLARKYHPDLNRDDPKTAEEKFKEVNEAYEILSDPKKRQAYDQFGHAAFDGTGGMGAGASGGAGFGGFGNFGGFQANGDFGDIFSDIFDAFAGGGGRRARQQQQRGPVPGADLRYDMELTLEEAAFGVRKTLKIPRTITCPDCHGTGAATGTKPEPCPDCHGTGVVRTAQRTPFGNIMSERPCAHCHGTGEIIKTPCAHCHGEGVLQEESTVTATIPKGVDNGQRVRVPGAGEAGRRGGPSGDLYIYVFLKPHRFFKRNGADVICETPVSFVQAALGDKVEVPTLKGTKTLSIPAGVQSGTLLRMKGEGIPHLRGTDTGDQYVRVKVLTPQNLTDKQKDALKNFGALCGENVNPEQTSWKEKLKSFFA